MEKEQVKRWLCRYPDIMREIEVTEERYITLKNKSVSASAPILDSLPHGSGNRTDRTAMYIIRLEEIKERLQCQNEEANKIYYEIEAAVKQIKGVNCADKRAVIRMKYLDLCSWPEIAEMLFAQKENFYDKEESYIRRVFKIHQRAIDALAELLQDLETEERKNEYCKI